MITIPIMWMLVLMVCEGIVILISLLNSMSFKLMLPLSEPSDSVSFSSYIASDCFLPVFSGLMLLLWVNLYVILERPDDYLPENNSEVLPLLNSLLAILVDLMFFRAVSFVVMEERIASPIYFWPWPLRAKD